MIIPAAIFRKIRQRGKFVDQGDSLQSGFGGAVPWSTQANTNWWPDQNVDVNLGVAGQVVGPSSDSTSMLAHVGDLTAQFDGAKDYNIGTMWGGANDIQAGRTGAAVYADITTWNTTVKAAGFKTMILCVVRMNKPAGFQAERTILNNDILANSIGADGVVDLDSIPGTPGDGINYNADGIHLTTAGQTAAMNLILPVWKTIVGLP